ncbi:MAG: hypothetical protein V5A44_12940 [Haloarculaceae archaeon]
MNRRALLRSVAAAGTLSLTAGCLADDSPGGEPAATDDETPTPTPDDSDTPTDGDTPGDTHTPTDTAHVDTVSGTSPPPEPSETPRAGPDAALTVTNAGCGAQVDEASVTFDGSAVAITGTVWGNDACYTATLAETHLDGDTLTVVVASVSDAGTDTMCAQCITEVDYEVDVAFDGDPPDRVEVRHRHDGSTATVATADR